MKRTLVCNLRAETGRQSMALFDLTDDVHLGWLQFLTDLRRSANDRTGATGVDLGIRTHLSEEANSQIRTGE